MTGLLSCGRPRELLRVRHCDLVPPLRGALQNLSGPLSRKVVPYWMSLTGQSSKNPPRSFTNPNFFLFSRKRQQSFTFATISTPPMKTFWPVNPHSRRLPVVGASQKNEDGGKSRTFSNDTRGTPALTQSRESLPERVRQSLRSCDEQLEAVLRGVPAHGSSGTCDGLY